MTPTFADAVDPIILEVLDVVDEIAKNPSVAPAPLRMRVQQRFALPTTASASGKVGSWPSMRSRAGPTNC